MTTLEAFLTVLLLTNNKESPKEENQEDNATTMVQEKMKETKPDLKKDFSENIQ